MQTITTKSGVVVQGAAATRADMSSAVPTVYTRAFPASGNVRVLVEIEGERTVLFEGDYGAIKGFVQPIEVRVREHSPVAAGKVPLDDVQAAAVAEAERLANEGS